MPEEVMDYGSFDMVGEFLRWHNIYLVNSQKEKKKTFIWSKFLGLV